MPAAIFGLGGTELIVILVILLVLFGGTKLPSLARGLGQSLKEFKKSAKDDEAKDAEKPAETKEPADTTTKTHGPN